MVWWYPSIKTVNIGLSSEDERMNLSIKVLKIIRIISRRRTKNKDTKLSSIEFETDM